MQYTRRSFVAMLAVAAATPLAACARSTSSTSSSTQGGASASSLGCSVPLDNAKWNYDGDNDIYYQIGAVYCASPQAADYESCAIYVPGAYMKGTKNSDGTYTCTPNESGSVAGFTAKTAPIVMPINTGGYSAQAAATSYDATGLSTYMQAGLVYVFSGCRGKNNGTDASGNLQYPGGAPWGVTDLKACVRFLRGNASVLPGNTDRIFTFGHSGGGAQSSLMGATGDSDLFKPYLNQIGAVMTDASGNQISDAICGSMCWCPVTSLDYADEAYEWNMGQFASTGTRADGTFTKVLSNDMANAYASYINQLGLQDSKGNTLSLSSSDSGVFTAGSYYDYLVGVVETSLNNFLSDTTFPYTPSSTTMADGGFPGSGSSGGMGTGGGKAGGGMPSGGAPSGVQGGQMPSGGAPSGAQGGQMPSGGMVRGGMGGTSASAVGTDSSATYATVQDYIAALNANTTWVIYDEKTNTAKVTGLRDFSQQCKQPSKDVCAFDSLSKSAAENSLFCTPSQATSHFDSTVAGLLQQNQSSYSSYSDWSSSYPSDYQNDLQQTDCANNTIAYRLNAYNPMYYLTKFYAGYDTAKVAPHWRINTGINQGDTALTVEANLALALQAYRGVSDVNFTTVWGKAHTPAERTNDAATNLISWVTDCCK